MVLVLHTVVFVLVLILQVWCCVLKHDLITLVVIMILKDTTTSQVLFIVSLFCAWNITWRSTVAFTYLKFKSTNCLALLIVVLVVLVLRIWSFPRGSFTGLNPGVGLTPRVSLSVGSFPWRLAPGSIPWGLTSGVFPRGLTFPAVFISPGLTIVALPISCNTKLAF